MAHIRAISLAALLALCSLFTGVQAASAQDATSEASSGLQFPKLTGRVVDDANIIPDAQEAQLTQKLEALEKQSHRQLVVVTLPSLNGYEISDYGYQLGRAWGIGQKAENNGSLLIVAPNERKVRIEVGYGLEPILTDGMSSLIINRQILPRFREGDMAGGIVAGTDAIIKQITLPPEEAMKIAAQADAQKANQGDDISLGTVIFILFVIFFFILPILRSATGSGGKQRRSGAPIIWVPGGFGGGFGGGGDWGGGSGGGFGGGGFGGGGGSFGGGGASGSW